MSGSTSGTSTMLLGKRAALEREDAQRMGETVATLVTSMA